MPVSSTALPVTSGAYLRICLVTGDADLICSPQVKDVLNDVLGSLHGDVTIWPYGMLMSREEGRSAQFHPLHRSGWRSSHHDRYLLTTYRGITAEPRGVLSYEDMCTQVMRARGTVYGLADGSVVSVLAGRLAARWTPAQDPEVQR